MVGKSQVEQEEQEEELTSTVLRRPNFDVAEQEVRIK